MSRGRWRLAGVVTMVVGLATSYATAMALTIRESPVVAVAELIIRITPGPLAERLIRFVGQLDKPLLILGILLFLLAMGALAGSLARTGPLRPMLVWLAMAVLGGIAVMVQPGASGIDVVPVVVGFVTWMAVLPALTAPLIAERNHPELESRERRVFLMVAIILGVASIGLAGAGRVVGRGRRHVAESRRLLRLDGVTRPMAPAETAVGLPGISPWQTPSDDFYLIHTAIAVPTIEPKDWTLRIHGLVDREVTLTYNDLVSRQLTESWITLNCVSNEVGGDLVGNAWWSGIRIADLLEEIGLDPDADCILQTSEDGWNCATPLSALTDDRNAMLAIAMNGKPLPIEHGFPVRTIVPGLYGYVSATKWVVDYEVTRFSDVDCLLDPARVVGAGSGQDRLAHRRTPLRRRRVHRRGQRRRPRVGPAHRHRIGRGRRRRWRVGGRAAGRQPDRRHLGAVGADDRPSTRATTRSGCARPTRPGWNRRAYAATCCPTASTGWHTIQVRAR